MNEQLELSMKPQNDFIGGQGKDCHSTTTQQLKTLEARVDDITTRAGHSLEEVDKLGRGVPTCSKMKG